MRIIARLVPTRRNLARLLVAPIFVLATLGAGVVLANPASAVGVGTWCPTVAQTPVETANFTYLATTRTGCNGWVKNLALYTQLEYYARGTDGVPRWYVSAARTDIFPNRVGAQLTAVGSCIRFGAWYHTAGWVNVQWNNGNWTGWTGPIYSAAKWIPACSSFA